MPCVRSSARRSCWPGPVLAIVDGDPGAELTLYYEDDRDCDGTTYQVGEGFVERGEKIHTDDPSPKGTPMLSSQRCEPVDTVRAHAVVIGASMAGLASAVALTERFERVTVVERDRLPTDVAHRKGVPQDRHLHLLLPAGVHALDALLPGVIEEMVSAGAARGDADRIRLCLNGHRLAPGRAGQVAVFASRPFVEAHVRQRVREHPDITLVDGHVVRGVAASSDRRRITGVRTAGSGDGHAERVVPADLVVDCSGRGSRASAWITQLGYHAPRVDELRVDVRYATLRLALPSDALGGDLHVLVGPTPEEPRGGAMTHVDTDRWMVTLFGMGDEEVPMDAAALERFAQRLPIPDLYEALRDGEVLDAPVGYRFPANVRHRYEELAAFPQRLLVSGDAVCSFNPIYGQGMSVALEAVTLRSLLRDAPLPAAREWFRAIAPTIANAWELAIGADLAVRSIEGRRSPLTRMTDRYLRSVHAAAVHDPALSSQFVRVAGTLDPPRALLRPTTVLRVVRGTVLAHVAPRMSTPRAGRASRSPPDRQ